MTKTNKIFEISKGLDMNTKGQGLVRAVARATVVVAGLTLAAAATQAGQMGGNSVKPTGQMGGNSALKSVASGFNGTAKPIVDDATCGTAVSLLDPSCI